MSEENIITMMSLKLISGLQARLQGMGVKCLNLDLWRFKGL